ncbi:helix-turn-helix domain-containing protein [Paenibacillus mucilaginosus]|uniref:Transcriptional regulator, AraC family n=1 Tax=Paenibacillus mucilaginosus (strain KNP414) TaxID=1036673 RepID=F8FJH5_PAEMK|nr:helix-turn-helix domain-containing protein [Paenibacillus mucilaginosus]AEI42825.1 transcriptional regulator, AraC family [Paenibacillus mucilaginosus KNP414]MCG7216459.1 helix-turn-helix domain-containing protein [Paenibacillus mucilaginosus]WDM31000.1 helix-turn-helix domain-containing protein [Paenibacillus mucilaginosus]
MQQQIWSNFSPVFRKFLVSYLIILILPNIAGYASYRASIDVAKSSSIENSTKTLRLSKEILERRLQEVEGFTKQLAINQDLNRLIVDPRPLDANNVVGLGRMQRSLTNYSSTNDYLANYFVYLQNYNVMITPNTLFYRPEHYYELHQLENMSFAEWNDTILKKPHLNEIMPLRTYTRNEGSPSEKSTAAITFLQSLPINSFNNPQATVAVIIDEEKMGSMFQNTVEQYGGWAMVTDLEGGTLISQGIDDEEIARLGSVPTGVEGDTMRFEDGQFLISIKSELNGWLYTAGIPEEAIMEKANRIKRVTGILTGAASIAGLLIGLLLAYRHSAPIHRLLTVFREYGSSGEESARNDLDFIAGNISKLITSSKRLETELQEQLPLLRDAFIKRLLVGEFSSAREVEAVSSQTGIEVIGGQGHVGILKINGYGGLQSEEIVQELSVWRLLLKQMLQEAYANILITDWGTDKIAVVFMQDDETAGDDAYPDETPLMKLQDTAYRQYRLSFNIGMGAKYTVLSDVSRSFNEALQALDYATYVGAEGVTRYEDAVRESAMYYYPLDSEQRLLNTLKAGECEESQRILAQLFTRNFEERDLSYEMTQQFIIELKGTFLKLTEKKILHNEVLAEEIKSRIAQIQPTEGVLQIRRTFEGLVEDICSDVVRKKSDMNAVTVKAVIDFINEQYSDQDLTLYRVAERIGRPEKFISQLFKEHTGENLSEYVELVRITKAAELLLENRLTIDEIAVQVGYNSAHSFRRAFKRVRGVSPSAFRQIKE